MRCTDIDRLIEGLAEDDVAPSPDVQTHLAACPLCQGRLARARAVQSWLMVREVPAPPPSFTADVMALVRQERWQAERAIDIGFNLAVAAGVVLILGGAVGLAWSAGLLTLGVDLRALVAEVTAAWTARLLSQVQTIVMAAVLLTMALGAWWWAEADPLV